MILVLHYFSFQIQIHYLDSGPACRHQALPPSVETRLFRNMDVPLAKIETCFEDPVPAAFHSGLGLLSSKISVGL